MNYKRFSLIILFLVPVSVLGGLLISVLKKPYPETAQKMIKALDQKDYEGVYFGDSVLYFNIPEERDTRTVVDFLNELGSASALECSHGSFSPLVIKDYCRILAQREKKPKFVIVPINLRSFSPEWYLRPMYQFQKDRIKVCYQTGDKNLKTFTEFLVNLFYKNLHLNVEEREWNEQHFFVNGKDLGTHEILQKTEDFESYYSFVYLNPISEDHPMLASIRDMADFLRQHDITLVMYFTPINMSKVSESVGRNKMVLIDEKINFIRRFLDANDIPVMNLAYDLPDKNFPDRYEHLDPEGKAYVAFRVKEFLESVAAF